MFLQINRPTWQQILSTSIVSTRINTLFLNEVDTNESPILLKTIYVPKRLSYLTEKLPKSMYGDNDATEDETVLSRVAENLDETDKLPKLNIFNHKINQK